MLSVKKLRMKKWLAIGAVLVVLVGGGMWWYSRLSPSDCTSIEHFDALTGSCYYECTDDADCSANAAEIDKELNAYFEGSQSRVAPTKPRLPQSNQSPTATSQLTLDDTGSDTHGKVYTVTSSQTLIPTPAKTDAGLWQLFTKIASKQTIGERLLSFEVFNDANNDSAASVWQSQQDSAKWHMNVNAAFAQDRKDLIHTMVHEFGHIITLNTLQVEQVEGTCPRFQIAEGCTRQGSYLANFEQRFWEKYGEHIPANDGENQDDVAAFYQGKETAFVTDYAATNPTEDLAETWAYFVLRARPTDTSEKSQKIISLYAYPELVQLRDRIRSNLGSELAQKTD